MSCFFIGSLDIYSFIICTEVNVAMQTYITKYTYDNGLCLLQYFKWKTMNNRPRNCVMQTLLSVIYLPMLIN